jgi:hypothetical protein
LVVKIKICYLCSAKTFIFGLIIFLFFAMKKLKFVAVATIVVAACVCGCKSFNNVAPPEIVFGDGPVASVKKGDSKEIALAVKTKGKLKRVSFFRKNANGEEELFGTPVVKFSNKERYESMVTLQEINTGVVFVVEAVDAKDQTSRAEYVIALADSIASTTPSGDATPVVEKKSFVATEGTIELGFHKNTTVGSSYRVKKNKVADLYWAMQYSSSVDFMFFYGRTNGVTIVAPSDELAASVFNNTGCGVPLWETRNSTTLVKSSVSFEGATLSEVETEVNAAASTSVNQLKQGDVVAFKTADGQVGVIQVISAGSDAESTLNINVKVLK